PISLAMLPISHSSRLVLLFLLAVSISFVWRRFERLPEVHDINPSTGPSHSSVKTARFFKAKYSSSRDGRVDISAKDSQGDMSTFALRTLLSINTTFFKLDPATHTTLEIRPNSKSEVHDQAVHKTVRRKRENSSTANWSLLQRGNTGVSAQQITVVGEKFALIIDKVEHNSLKINGRPAWAALYNLETDEVMPLSLKSNSFCAGGSFLSNGTLLNIGGNAPEFQKQEFGDTNGLQSIRFYTPCDDGKCAINEYANIKLTTARWYPTSTRLPDGSVMIVGGSTEDQQSDNRILPSEKFQANAKSPVFSPFLNRTLVTNLFPIVIALPIPDMIFMAANNAAMLYNWKTNTETPLPSFPNGVRVTYPFTGSGVLLPLSPRNNYTPEVLVCGGTDLDDRLPATSLRVSDPASSQCARMVLTDTGIKDGWKIEQMPSPRIMPDLIMMPDGRVLIVNGAKTGVAGYGNLVDRVGGSNADNPNFTPVLYDPDAPAGHRFTTEGMPTSRIPRLYHSVAALVPSGKIIIAGSNPNKDFSTNTYPTEYRVEWLSPPYLTDPSRPVISEIPRIANYKERITVKLGNSALNLSTQGVKLQAVLLDHGYAFRTHGLTSSKTEYHGGIAKECATSSHSPFTGNLPTWTCMAIHSGEWYSEHWKKNHDRLREAHRLNIDLLDPCKRNSSSILFLENEIVHNSNENSLGMQIALDKLDFEGRVRLKNGSVGMGVKERGHPKGQGELSDNKIYSLGGKNNIKCVKTKRSGRRAVAEIKLTRPGGGLFVAIAVNGVESINVDERTRAKEASQDSAARWVTALIATAHWGGATIAVAISAGEKFQVERSVLVAAAGLTESTG
ncbi:hypothetical protein PSTT_06024, partial [Puccinia striiformis]